MHNEFVWAEKYRPRNIDETILPEDLKATFNRFVESGKFPNLLLHGTSGIGKTTAAIAMLSEMGCEYVLINGSMNNGIDTLRTDIQAFASTVSLVGTGKKYVILDEADYLTANTQAALRNFMEEYSANCGFILTCNFLNKIIEPLHSRCSVISFNFGAKEKPSLATQFYKRVTHILDSEGIGYDKKAVAELINLHYPDYRRILNELQYYSATGKIDSGILRMVSVEELDALIDHLKEKKFTAARKWMAEHSDLDSSVFYKMLYDILPGKVKNTSTIAEVIYTLADYQYKEAFVANPEINRMACVSVIMGTVTDWI